LFTLSKILCSNQVVSNNQALIIAVSILLSHHIIMDIHTIKNTIHNTFLNIQSGELAHLSLLINFCHNKAINNNISQSHKAYANKFISPIKKLTGSITAKITAYVGLQLENTGQSDIQINILHSIHFFPADFHKFLLELSENHIFVEKFFHKFGKIVIIQNNINITPENNFQTIGSTHIKIVEAFSKSENIIIDTTKDNIIMYGLDLLLESSTDAHNITGKSGNTHGASIVRIHAKNEIINNVIFLVLKNKSAHIICIYLKVFLI